MSPTLNKSSALQRFECGNAIEIRNEIMFDYYLRLPHMYYANVIEGHKTITCSSHHIYSTSVWDDFDFQCPSHKYNISDHIQFVYIYVCVY